MKDDRSLFWNPTFQNRAMLAVVDLSVSGIPHLLKVKSRTLLGAKGIATSGKLLGAGRARNKDCY